LSGAGSHEVDLLRGSDAPREDQLAFFKSQIVFWLIGATDGHAKNFSLFLRPAGRFRLTPFYDVLTAQPSLDAEQIRRSGFKLAMPAGNRGHYRIHEITGRHFVETARRARLPRSLVQRAIEEILAAAATAFERVQPTLPPTFPGAIHDSVQAAATVRVRQLEHARQ
jgi:serine/threonine-protein kinase HipA